MSKSTRVQVKTEIFFPALTVEFALYAGFVLVAFLMRVFFLGDQPLTMNEARQALASWNFVLGKPDNFTGSPFLFTGNAILFALFGANDRVARILPTLFGSGLVLLPAFLRRELGRFGALGASALFMFSPSLVFFSRELNGAVVAATCSLAAFVFGWRYVNDRAARDLYVAATFAALALLSGSEVWTFLLATAIFVFVFRPIVATLTITKAPPSLPSPLWERKEIRVAATLFALVYFGVATTFLFHRDGLGAAFDLFSMWLDSWRFGGTIFESARLFLVYEPLLIFLGGAGLFYLFSSKAPQRDRDFLNALAVWAIVVFALSVLNPGTNRERIAMVIAPLALVAGKFLGEWVLGAQKEYKDLNLKNILTQEVPVFLLALALASFAYLVIAEFTTRGSVLPADLLAKALGSNNASSNGFVVAALALAIFTAIAVLAIMTLGIARARKLGVTCLLTLTTVWALRQNALLNFQDALNPREALVEQVASLNVRDLVNDLESVSRWRANDSHTLVIIADQALGSIAVWNLRTFRNARIASHPIAAEGAQAMLLQTNVPSPSGNWISQRYQLQVARGAETQTNILRWLIFRDVGNLESTDAVLWIKQP